MVTTHYVSLKVNILVKGDKPDVDYIATTVEELLEDADFDELEVEVLDE